MDERRAFLKRTGMVLLGTATAGVLLPKLSPAREKKSQPAMIIDVNRCTGCLSCVIACKEHNLTPAGYFNTRVEKKEEGAYSRAWPTYTPELCHHCQDAPCVTACPYEATFALASGIVVTDWSLCTGDGACVTACPYGARFQDPDNGDKAAKCDFCVDLLEAGLSPACVENCPPHARIFGDLANPQGEFAEYLQRIEKSQTEPSGQLQERVFYVKASKS